MLGKQRNNAQAKAKAAKKSSGNAKKLVLANPPKAISFAPAAQQAVMVTQKPSLSTSVQKTGDGSIRVRHREYIQDFNGSSAFAVSSFPVNPGMAQTFPWLSTLALNYETYLFRELRFEYEPLVATSASGSIMQAMDYDASDSAPVNKQQIMAYQGAVRSASWQESCCVCDKADLSKYSRRYIRSGTLASNLDIKTYDVGQLFLAAQNCSVTTGNGELYVIYDVELQTPQTDLVGAISAFSAKMASTSTSLTGPFNNSTVTGSLPLSTAVATQIAVNRVGQFILECEFTGTVFTGAGPTISGSSATVSQLKWIFDTAATSAVLVLLVQVNSAGQVVSINLTGSATTVTAATGRFCAYQNSLA